MRRDLSTLCQLPKGQKRTPRADTLPQNVFVEATNRCNYKCTTCPNIYQQYEPYRDLRLVELQAIAEQFPDMGRAVLHGIGEPLLNPELPKIVGYLKRRGVYVLFNSNGALLDEIWARCMVLNLLDEYRLSLKSTDPEEYQRAHGGGNLQKVIDNLQRLVSVKAELGAALPRISIWCMGIERNLDQIPRLIRLAARIGVPEVYLKRMPYHILPKQRRGLAQAEISLFGNLTPEEKTRIVRYQTLADQLGVSFGAVGATSALHSPRAARQMSEQPWTACLRPWTTTYITANGNVLPCSIAPFATTEYHTLILGNIWEQDFASIWNGSAYQEWREALQSPEPKPACKECGVYWNL